MKVPGRERISLYDKEGNQYAISKEEWAKNVLPKELKKEWASSDRLYNLIVMCLRDEIYDVLIEPIIHLLIIDNSSRAYSVAGIVYMKNGRLEDAERIIKEGLINFPKDYTLLTNLAKVSALNGDKELSYNTLWDSLMLDPNQENGLNWIGAIHFEKGGEKERIKIFEQIAMLPVSWRAQLFIARSYLEKGQLNNAKEIYLEVLSKAIFEADVVMMITGDLGKNGKIEEIFEIIYPIFELRKHGINAGINIVQAAILSERREIAIEVLSDIKQLNRLDYVEIINKLEEQIKRMRNIVEG